MLMGRLSDNGDVHRKISWMVAADTSILRLMNTARGERDERLDHSPQTLAWNTGYSRQHCGNRCRELVDNGLVIRMDRARYRIGTVGVWLMEGGVRPRDLPD